MLNSNTPTLIMVIVKVKETRYLDMPMIPTTPAARKARPAMRRISETWRFKAIASPRNPQARKKKAHFHWEYSAMSTANASVMTRSRIAERIAVFSRISATAATEIKTADQAAKNGLPRQPARYPSPKTVAQYRTM